MEISAVKVKPAVEQVWMAKQDAIVYFGYENHTSVFQKILAEFSKHEDFKEGYILATSGIPIVRIAEFENFLRWRQVNKFKRKKGVNK